MHTGDLFRTTARGLSCPHGDVHGKMSSWRHDIGALVRWATLPASWFSSPNTECSLRRQCVQREDAICRRCGCPQMAGILTKATRHGAEGEVIPATDRSEEEILVRQRLAGGVRRLSHRTHFRKVWGKKRPTSGRTEGRPCSPAGAGGRDKEDIRER